MRVPPEVLWEGGGVRNDFHSGLRRAEVRRQTQGLISLRLGECFKIIVIIIIVTVCAVVHE